MTLFLLSAVGGIDVRPGWKLVQVEHGDSPGVDGQHDGEDTQDVQHKPGFDLGGGQETATEESGRKRFVEPPYPRAVYLRLFSEGKEAAAPAHQLGRKRKGRGRFFAFKPG